MNARRLIIMAFATAHLASTAAADNFTWNFQRTGFRSTMPAAPQTAISMRSDLSWPVVYGIDAGMVNAYSLFPVANSQVQILPATNWHRIGTNITKGLLPPGNIYLQAASGAPDGFGLAVQTSTSLTQPPSVTVWGTSTSGFHAPQSNTQAIKFDEAGHPFIASSSMIPFSQGRPEVLHDVALSRTGDVGAITQQSNGLGPLNFWQRSPLLGGNWFSTPLTPTGEQTLFGPSADVVYDTSSRPHVIGLNRVTTSNSVVAYHFNITSGLWELNILEGTLNSPPIADVAAAANDDGMLGAAWVNNGVLKYAYMDTNEQTPNWVVTTVASSTPTGVPLETVQGVGLAYDKTGLPVISFVERSNRQIWVAYDPPLITTPSGHASGDFNDDGLVDGGDLNAWTAGMSDASSAGDADADGDSDGADFLTWQRQLGGAAPVAGAAAVPEPQTLALFVTAAAAMALRRRVPATRS
jgi:hypothetical protein